MAIIRQQFKKAKKRKPTEAERKLRDEWDRILQSHSKPLDQGLKARGKLPGTGAKTLVKPQYTSKLPEKSPDQKLPSLPMGYGGTKPAIDPLAEAKQSVKARTGQVYNKGGVQYLTDEDLKEQKSGSHRRR